MDVLYLVRSWPQPGLHRRLPQTRRPIPCGDGQEAAWNRNGKEIFYTDDHSRMVSVAVTAHGESLELGRPQPLFPTQPVGSGEFEIAPDGKRFLMMQAPVENSSNLTLIVNWLQELKK